MSTDNDNLLEIYTDEVTELTDNLEKLLYASEDEGCLGGNNLAEAFRIMHTVKGSSAMMGYNELAATAHLLENVLSKARDNKIKEEDNRIVIHLCFKFLEYCKKQIKEIINGGTPIGDKTLNDQVEELLSGEIHEKKQEAAEVKAEAMDNSNSYVLRVRLKECTMANTRAYVIVKSLTSLCKTIETNPANPQRDPQTKKLIEENGIELSLHLKDNVKIEEVYDKVSKQPYFYSYELVSMPEEKSDNQSMRINVKQEKLNELLSLVSEMVNSETILEQILKKSGKLDPMVDNYLTQIRNYASSVHNKVSELGMVEIGIVFFQMKQLIRTMSKDFNKEIKLEITGDDVLVDRSVVEPLKESLIHIIRNAVDHGIENKEERERVGKPYTGIIKIEAKPQNGQVRISIEDDGKGIDKEEIVKIALGKNILTKDPKHCSNSEILNIILTSGFSTKKNVSQYSGRGVGLDAVATKIRDIGGNLSLDSKKGIGTTFYLDIPLTLTVFNSVEAIIDGSKILIPLSTIESISKESEQNTVLIDNKTELYLKTSDENDRKKGERLVIFKEGFGQYYIRASYIGNINLIFVKPLPQFMLDALGNRNPFDGCIVDSDGRIRCLLSPRKLILVNERSK